MSDKLNAEDGGGVGSSALLAAPLKPSPRSMLAMWRARESAMRSDERLCGSEPKQQFGLARWFEGQADALSRCADELEYIILPQLETTLINIQHEETGRLQEWPVSEPIPHGWAKVSETFKAANGELSGVATADNNQSKAK